MKELFVSHEIALKLKELGFDEPCITFYPKEGKIGFDGKYHSIREGYKNSTVNAIWIKKYQTNFECVTAPLYQQAFRWFRDKYNLLCWINKDWNDGTLVGYEGTIEQLEGLQDCGTFETYEEAEIECLKKLIEIVS